MKCFLATLSIVACALAGSICAQNDQPAMIGQGPDSVAAKLHYPPSAKASKNEGAVQFYCEVGTDGRARHVRVLAENVRGPFASAVDKGVHLGRFMPARVGGKAVPAMIGGTVLFVNVRGPAIIVSLTSADKQKAASGANYIQPQMAMSFNDLERKTIIALRTSSTNVTGGGPPAAEILFDVNENGTVTGSRIVGENPKGLGDVLTKACAGAKFIPATANGKRVAGQFNLPIDFQMMKYPDDVTGSHLAPRQE